jgi:hypothetical protein
VTFGAHSLPWASSKTPAALCLRACRGNQCSNQGAAMASTAGRSRVLAGGATGWMLAVWGTWATAGMTPSPIITRHQDTGTPRKWMVVKPDS